MQPRDQAACWDQLVNVPTPHYYESASCWLSRLALSQGTDLIDLLMFLGVTNKGDIDRELHGASLGAIRRICNLPESALIVHERVMVGLKSMGKAGLSYLVTSRAQRPKFRFCPRCLTEMHTPHFPIHWRFIAWRWCPAHDCLLEDACPHCGGEITFPTDIARSAAGKNGYGLLNRCLSCGGELSKVEPCYLSINGFRRVTALEEMSLRNGRALLATLYYGRFQIKGQPGWQHPKKFRNLERSGVLPVKFDWLRPVMIRERSNAVLTSGCSRWSGKV